MSNAIKTQTAAGTSPKLVFNYESTIMVEFFPSGEWVRMVVTLSPMHDEEFTKLACQGLASQLANLDERFQSQYLRE
jgi:hypothetical protein